MIHQCIYVCMCVYTIHICDSKARCQALQIAALVVALAFGFASKTAATLTWIN